MNLRILILNLDLSTRIRVMLRAVPALSQHTLRILTPIRHEHAIVEIQYRYISDKFSTGYPGTKFSTRVPVPRYALSLKPPIPSLFTALTRDKASCALTAQTIRNYTYC